MIKDIKYSGHAAQPSDYECPDGQLDISMNLIPENGSLRPVPPPSIEMVLADHETAIFIHRPDGKKHLFTIRKTDNSASLYWCPFGDDIKDTSKAELIEEIRYSINDISAIGNVVVIATGEEGLRYYIWRERSYVSLGNRPPFVPIEFGCQRTHSGLENKTIGYDPVMFGQDFRYDSEIIKPLSTAIMGALLSSAAENATQKGFFYQPFFVRYAFRLFDGSYSWHSAPVLMLPVATAPIVRYAQLQGPPTSHDATLLLGLSENLRFVLMRRILQFDTDRFALWKDIVSSIDIFVSAPIYTFDQSEDLKNHRTVSYPSYMKTGGAFFKDNLAADVPSRFEEPEETEQNPDIDSEEESTNGTSPEEGSPLSRAVDMYDISRSDSSDNHIFVGNYADPPDERGKAGDYFLRKGKLRFLDRFIDISVGKALGNLYEIPVMDKFKEHICDCANFYKFAEIKFEEIVPSDEHIWVKPYDNDLSALVARPTLPDDYASHGLVIPSVVSEYNARINMANAMVSPPAPLPIRTCIPANSAATDSDAPALVKITVWSMSQGSRMRVFENSDLEAMRIYNLAKICPRYIFHPDAGAYKMKIEIDGGPTYIIPLKPHDFLNGAYFISGHALANPENAADEASADAGTYYNASSKIYTSEANNPFAFPATGITTVGNGSVLGLSAATKALSQGQFGQFPLYAFTDEGVWAMEVSSTGTFSARQPVTRDVCVSKKSITQTDSSVLFATRRGIMMLTGSNAVCITDTIQTETPFAINALPAAQQLLSLAKFTPEEVGLLSFSEFLQDAAMVYDYTNQRLHLFNPNRDYAYVYSMKSPGGWGMSQCDLLSAVNSYPEAFAMNRHGELVNLSTLSTPESQLISGLFVSRPIKLDAPDVLKTIDTVIQRGHFQRGHVQSVLYGSRDLYNWHLVWSSKDHYLRGFRGTPYKYFRIACVTTLAEGESVFGASLQFTPRQANQPR